MNHVAEAQFGTEKVSHQEIEADIHLPASCAETIAEYAKLRAEARMLEQDAAFQAAIGEGMGWKWREAQNQMIEASAAKIDQKKFRSLMQARAVEYCRGVLDEYNNWANGYVYGAICYVIDRLTGEVIDDHESECWGILGSEAAESELEAVMLAAALQLGCVLH